MILCYGVEYRIVECLKKLSFQITDYLIGQNYAGNKWLNFGSVAKFLASEIFWPAKPMGGEIF